MKKLSLLLFSVLFALCGLNAQTVVLSEDFSAIVDSNSYTITNSLDEYTQVPGWTGDWVYPSNGKVKIGKSAEAGFLQTPALNLSANNGQFVVTFDAKAWTNDATSLIVAVDGVPYTVEGLSTSTFNTFSVPLSGGTAATVVKFQGFQASHGRFFLDNVIITSQELGPDTEAPFVANVTPSNNSLAVTFNEVLDPSTAQNISNYSLDNGISISSATLNGSVVTLAVSPALTEGNTYTLIVNNVADVAGNFLTADTITFTYGVAQDFQVANIAALRAKWTDELDVNGTHFGNDVYKLTGHVIVTGINDSYRHQIFIQDASGAIVIDDPNGLITSALESGDEISDIYGKLTDYYGLLQFAVSEPYTASALSIYNDVTPLTVSLADLQNVSYMNAHQCELIRMESVKINPLTSNVFENGKKYTLTQNGQTGNGMWIHFYNIEGLTGEAIPTSPVNLLGVNKISYSEYYLIPRTGADLGTGLPQYLTENDLVVYPNPVSNRLTVTLRTDKFQISNMAVYDINGKLVRMLAVSDNQIEMNTQGLAAGSYFLRLSDGKNCVTTKFVKK
ncbi:MAG: T9SS type A sorting domain-containing protein [Bacteroidales bacterium]|nr:T9SS type A sorting domain-containing protein [Bacteroidales bacterium]